MMHITVNNMQGYVFEMGNKYDQSFLRTQPPSKPQNVSFLRLPIPDF